jgi:hypothetical protein
VCDQVFLEVRQTRTNCLQLDDSSVAVTDGPLLLSFPKQLVAVAHSDIGLGASLQATRTAALNKG